MQKHYHFVETWKISKRLLFRDKKYIAYNLSRNHQTKKIKINRTAILKREDELYKL